MTREVRCPQCDEVHSLESGELAFEWPDEIFALAEDARAERCELNAEFCAIDQQRFFLRGLLPIPVKGRIDIYRIGVWAQITLNDYKRIYDLWSDPDQSSQPRIPGVLANSLPLQRRETLGLAVAIQLTGPRTRPEYFVEVIEHELRVEQQLGIDEHRALAYSGQARHSED